MLGDVRAAVEDWPKMRTKALEIAADLDKMANPAQIAELRQAQELLRWLDDGNFTFLGYREYDLVNDPARTSWNSGRTAASVCSAAAPTPARSSTSPRPAGGRHARSAPL